MRSNPQVFRRSLHVLFFFRVFCCIFVSTERHLIGVDGLCDFNFIGLGLWCRSKIHVKTSESGNILKEVILTVTSQNNIGTHCRCHRRIT